MRATHFNVFNLAFFEHFNTPIPSNVIVPNATNENPAVNNSTSFSVIGVHSIHMV